MQHVDEERLVAHYYHDDEDAPAVREHLAACVDCRARYDSLCGVLTLVTDLPVPERGNAYEEQVWARLRWKLGASRRRARWQSALAAAAVLAAVFFAGQWWSARRNAPAEGGRAPKQAAAAAPASAAGTADSARNRVLVIVVGDHLETSERVLAQLANADPNQGYEVGDQQRASELVASNRLYRQAASQGGDQQIASLLSDIEPILVELSHAGATLKPEELASIQKRIESKGLLFKVRVMSAQSAGGDQAPRTGGSV